MSPTGRCSDQWAPHWRFGNGGCGRQDCDGRGGSMEHDKLDGRDAPAEEHEAGANKPITRKKFIAGAGAAGAGIALAGLPGVASARGWAAADRNKALANGLAPGKIGGPVGFKGAERYQYPANSEEGRAILAVKALRKAGKAPDTIVVQALNFARPQFENKFPAGATRSIKALWEQETG